MRATVVSFLCLILLQGLVGVANTAMAPYHLYLFAGGLFLPYSALQLPLGAGMAASILGGLVCDAASPLPFGTHTLLFAAAHAILYQSRSRFPRDEPLVQLWAALATNLALYLAISDIVIVRTHVVVRSWPRLTADLLWSECVVALVAPWFFALQAQALKLARAEG